MLRVISLVLILGLLASIGTSIAEVLDPQPDSQWEFLGKTICDSDIPNKTFYIWKKINSTNEFKSLQYQEPCTQDEINRNVCYYPEPVFYRMDTKHDFKMFSNNKYYKCGGDGRCYSDKYDKCIDETHGIAVAISTCKALEKQKISDCLVAGLHNAYDKKRTYASPNWNQLEQDAQETQSEVESKQDQRRNEIVSPPSSESILIENQSDDKMKILKHESAGCFLKISNETVYDFDIKINGSYYGTIPSRKVAVIRDLNCDGFMAEAWPQGAVTGSVHRAFQHSQKDSNGKFHWTLKYK